MKKVFCISLVFFLLTSAVYGMVGAPSSAPAAGAEEAAEKRVSSARKPDAPTPAASPTTGAAMRISRDDYRKLIVGASSAPVPMLAAAVSDSPLVQHLRTFFQGKSKIQIGDDISLNLIRIIASYLEFSVPTPAQLLANIKFNPANVRGTYTIQDITFNGIFWRANYTIRGGNDLLIPPKPDFTGMYLGGLDRQGDVCVLYLTEDPVTKDPGSKRMWTRSDENDTVQLSFVGFKGEGLQFDPIHGFIVGSKPLKPISLAYLPQGKETLMEGSWEDPYRINRPKFKPDYDPETAKIMNAPRPSFGFSIRPCNTNGLL